ncbi:MAG: class I SAM-dependent methyltransferase [candidate division Zixibacteria bacterium]|nr:class I SAM-dependent methyltransferase [candidate division Zixibacteria bacterium]
MTSERDRMAGVYRDREGMESRYSLKNPGNYFNFKLLLKELDNSFAEMPTKRSSIQLLDIGSGELLIPELMIDLGINRSSCLATDILHWRLVEGKKQNRDIMAVTADSSQMPFESNSFDVVSQFTLLTSVLDDSIRRKIASEMLRVLKPGGYILWYDFRYNNPGNPHTRAIGKKELASLFPEQTIDISSVTLIPPLARKVPVRLIPLLKFLHIIPMLRSHYLALIGPKG